VHKGEKSATDPNIPRHLLPNADSSRCWYLIPTLNRSGRFVNGRLHETQRKVREIERHLLSQIRSPVNDEVCQAMIEACGGEYPESSKGRVYFRGPDGAAVLLLVLAGLRDDRLENRRGHVHFEDGAVHSVPVEAPEVSERISIRDVAKQWRPLFWTVPSRG
jgi:hypothetical protein